MDQLFFNNTTIDQTVKLIHCKSDSKVEVVIGPGKEFSLAEYYQYILLASSTAYVYYCSDCYKYTLTNKAISNLACENCGDSLQTGI